MKGIRKYGKREFRQQKTCLKWMVPTSVPSEDIINILLTAKSEKEVAEKAKKPIRESKRAGKKFVPGGPNVILTKKTKPGFWMKHTDIIKACKELIEDAVDWQFQEGIINEERKQEFLESLKIVELAEQVSSFRFVSNIHSAIPVWYGKHFACRSGEGCGKTKGWTPIVLLRYLLEADILKSVTIGEAIISLTKQTKVWLPKNCDISCAIIGKFTQGNKVEEKRLTHQVVINKDELDFLIQDCVKEETYAGSDKCLLGHIFTYYEGHQL
ncbi:hypothetical protein RhiirC2_718025 [Rhizophagus irregularis]|uniref:Uncharacterized protein n=1 Tax=Rhizophagus irregularis TaxID=588596 RepID=A0A2N1MK65_9GLOM|nr:hypothetical protein RhiirC2_718025 [Rhizophagus irregularis]